MTAYSAFGLVVRSNVPLPGLSAVAAKPADCTFALGRGPIADRPTGLGHTLRRPDGTISLTLARCRSGYLVRFPGVAVYLVSPDGDAISGAREQRTRQQTVAHLFLTHVLPMALSLRGRLVLHASAVATPHGAVAFLGAAGQGKSTLSASFVRRAFPLITDDALLLHDHAGTLAGVPSFPEMRLWPDVLPALGRGGLEVHNVGQRTGKKRLRVDRVASSFCLDPVRVRRIYVLAPPETDTGRCPVSITACRPRDAFIELVKHSYRLDLGDRTRLRDEFESIGRVAARPALVYRLAFPRELCRLPAVQAAILEHCRT